MRERIIIVFIAIAIGLLITTLIYFLYQQTKSIPNRTNKIVLNDVSPSPTPKSSQYLTVDQPTDESISSKRSIQVKGKTNPNSMVVVSTNQEDIVGQATSDGAFSVSVTIDAGSNKILVRSISKDGVEAQVNRVVTYSTEDF
ncbi:MAG TPA: hypothetical protein VHE53_02855 [Patescibacteria group bacterium]|nr:hypothetical protein [Patescibacteria group bacterium]